jgi:hypothetical protein
LALDVFVLHSAASHPDYCAVYLDRMGRIHFIAAAPFSALTKDESCEALEFPLESDGSPYLSDAIRVLVLDGGI